MAEYSINAARTTSSNLAAAAGAWVGMALQPGLEYIQMIGANNPPEKVRKRKDVSAALAHAASGGRAKAMPLIESAWTEGVKAGTLIATDQIVELGLGRLPEPTIDDAIFQRLVDDIDRILSEAPDDILNAYVEGGDEAMGRAQRRAAYRVSLAVEAAFTHAQAAATVGALKETGTLKKWVTHSPLPCSHCVHLSLLPPIPWDEEFPERVPGLPILAVYSKKFLAPPRHPNCRCTLRAVKR